MLFSGCTPAATITGALAESINGERKGKSKAAVLSACVDGMFAVTGFGAPAVDAKVPSNRDRAMAMAAKRKIFMVDSFSKVLPGKALAVTRSAGM